METQIIISIFFSHTWKLYTELPPPIPYGSPKDYPTTNKPVLVLKEKPCDSLRSLHNAQLICQRKKSDVSQQKCTEPELGNNKINEPEEEANLGGVC